MDLENDTATILGKEIALNLTRAGHYCVQIDKCETIAVSDVCKEETQASEKLSQEKLLKLPRQFAHPLIKKNCSPPERCQKLEGRILWNIIRH